MTARSRAIRVQQPVPETHNDLPTPATPQINERPAGSSASGESPQPRLLASPRAGDSDVFASPRRLRFGTAASRTAPDRAPLARVIANPGGACDVPGSGSSGWWGGGGRSGTGWAVADAAGCARCLRCRLVGGDGGGDARHSLVCACHDGECGRTGLAAFAATVPLALAALFGGAIVDRVGARRASIGSDVLAGCAIASIPALHATGRLQYWHVLALASAVGAFDGPGRAARLALIPDLAARVDLPLERANGLARLAEHTGYVMGAPIGGALIATVGAPGALWIDAGSFAASALAVALTVPAAREKAPSSGYLRDLAAGVKFVAGERVLRTLLAMASAGSFSIAPLATVLLPVYARDRLGGAGAYAATVAAYGVGGVLGALTFGAIGTRVSRRAVYVGTWVVAAAASLVLVAL